MIKRIKWALATVGALALLALAAPWTLDDSNLRREMTAGLLERTGLNATIDGRIVLTLAPRPMLKMERISLRDELSMIDATANVARAQLRLLPMFAGRIEFTAIELSDASVKLDLDAFTAANRQLANAASRIPQLGGRAALANSTLAIKWHGQTGRQFEHLNGALDWPASGSPATLSANSDWNGEHIELAIWIAKPGALSGGAASPATFKFESRSATANLNGQLELGSRPQFEGKLAFSTARLDDFLNRTGIDAELPAAIGKLSATGSLKATPQSLALSDARLSTDGNAFEGSMVLAERDSRPLLSGTLATEQLQLAPLLASFPSVIGADSSWSHDPLPRPSASHIDLDLRLSATRAGFRRFRVQDAGLAIKLTDGQLDVALIDSRSFGGRLKGRLIAGARTGGVGAKLIMAFTNIDAGSFVGEFSRTNWLSGAATGQATLEAVGDCFEELVQSLDGHVEASIENGDFIGIDLDQALRRNERRPLSVPAEIRRGRTSFAKAQFAARIRDGKVEIDNATASGFSLATSVSGTMALPERSLAMRLTSSQTNIDGTQRPDAVGLAMDISGSWDDPRLDFDFDSLIRRSGAAAPLLKSLKP